MSERGSSGNVIAALASFIIPGLGQLVQGRPFTALLYLLLDIALWVILLGWIMHLWAAYDAAVYRED